MSTIGNQVGLDHQRYFDFWDKAKAKGWSETKTQEAWWWLDRRRVGAPRIPSYEARMRRVMGRT